MWCGSKAINVLTTLHMYIHHTNVPAGVSSPKPGIPGCFIHCCIPSTHNSAWNTERTPYIFVERIVPCKTRWPWFNLYVNWMFLRATLKSLRFYFLLTSPSILCTLPYPCQIYSVSFEHLIMFKIILILIIFT